MYITPDYRVNGWNQNPVVTDEETHLGHIWQSISYCPVQRSGAFVIFQVTICPLSNQALHGVDVVESCSPQDWCVILEITERDIALFILLHKGIWILSLILCLWLISFHILLSLNRIKVTDGQVITAGASVTWHVLPWSGVAMIWNEFRPGLGWTWGV